MHPDFLVLLHPVMYSQVILWEDLNSKVQCHLKKMGLLGCLLLVAAKAVVVEQEVRKNKGKQKNFYSSRPTFV